MKRKRYSEEKIISILKEHEAGASAKDLARRHGVAENTVYRWKAKFGGMEVSEPQQYFSLRLRHGGHSGHRSCNDGRSFFSGRRPRVGKSPLHPCIACPGPGARVKRRF
ncbi:MAG: transposase [Xanthomonadales bacterium]|nr:transposase [Xanthomonadales bacterium]